jgi:hypothetical protein
MIPKHNASNENPLPLANRAVGLSANAFAWQRTVGVKKCPSNIRKFSSAYLLK